MKIIAIYIFKIILQSIYFPLKLIPTNKNKIVFISRQTNEISIDFKLISEEIKRRDKNIKTVFLCKRINSGFLNSISYGFEILRQMYHLATSKVAIIDSYSIPVCTLNHKKSLFVLQIWHSIGKIKKSGYQTLDTPSGRNSKVAKALCMHKNYDKIISGGEAFTPFYEKGFNVTKDALLPYGLPRIDYLINNEQKLKDEIYKKYKEFKNKKVVYYTPTFRTYDVTGPDKMFKEYEKQDFILIVKAHPNQKIDISQKNIYTCPEFKSTDLLTIADYVITDYSSICLEAAILNKKVLFYVYDHEKYIKDNGINLDAYNTLRTCSSKKIEDLFDIINNDSYDDVAYQKFRKKYLPKKLGKSTELIVDYIMKVMSK